LVSAPRGLERHSIHEFRGHLKNAGLNLYSLRPKTLQLSIIGLTLLAINGCSRDVTNTLAKYAVEHPWSFRLVLKVKPLERLVPTDIDFIKEAVVSLSSRIQEKDSFRISLTRRMSSIDRRKLILDVAETVNHRVDLEKPDWIVLIEVLKDQTGVSVIRPKDVISLADARLG